MPGFPARTAGTRTIRGKARRYIQVSRRGGLATGNPLKWNLAVRRLFAEGAAARLRRRGNDMRDARVVHFLVERRQFHL